jgi:hypothetical protein
MYNTVLEHMLNHEISIDKFKRIRVIQNTFSKKLIPKRFLENSRY